MTSKAELAYIALETKLKTVVGLGLKNSLPNVSRRLEEPTQVAWDTMPALFINETGEDIAPSKYFEGYNAKQTLTCDLYLYVTTPTQEGVCSTQINDMVQAVRDCLYPDKVTNTQTLGGIVSHCWISGRIEIIEGVLDGQGIAIIPVNILTNT
jgi:hypothetical protein